MKLKNHVLVPLSFVIPSGDGIEQWPQETWGYPLGKHAQWLRQTWKKKKPLPEFALKDLQEISFAFDVNQYKWDHFIKPALCHYFDLYGNTDILHRFRIPCGDSKWPKKLWGYYLGARVFNIRSRGDFKVQIQADAELIAKLNFCYDTTVMDRDWREAVLPALKMFHQIYGHCEVPKYFKVPDDQPWPAAAAGMLLGFAVSNMRSKGYYAEQVARDDAELKKIEFVWSWKLDRWNNYIFPALKVYFQQRGHCHIPQHFVVPYTKPWPEKAYGLKLGIIICNIRTYSYYFDQIARDADKLASVGFDVEIVQDKWDRRVQPILAKFEELYGHQNVPVDFVVPSEAPWKKCDWGIQVGKLKLKRRFVRAEQIASQLRKRLAAF
ncbi:hypothetical protein PsorP6_001240 [Peronosclerospora sorghi]|uniref:Uncharacterized protein n=1 Tax=Peronosclerospora sorghi TaxID=230839 RepID=A0ACC0WR16_9STRA|nr:hypothetical protein PsorP6_001240 [Peronosclerospora sorghi]